jgi:2'-5' RNA ligase
VRLFFALALPDEVRSVLAHLQFDDPNYRWVDTLQAHLTLAFLGEQPESCLADLEAIGSAAAAISAPATLRLGEAGSFGPRSAPRVLWIGLAGDLPKLLKLHGALAHGLRQAGFPVEDRPFSPHITLARRRERAAAGKPVWPPRHIDERTFPLEKLTLFQSKLSPRGATYIALAQFELRPAAAD